MSEYLDVKTDQIELLAVYLRENDYEYQFYKFTHELWQDFYSAVRVLNKRFKK